MSHKITLELSDNEMAVLDSLSLVVASTPDATLLFALAVFAKALPAYLDSKLLTVERIMDELFEEILPVEEHQ
jgi:hypothetical protein